MRIGIGNHYGEMFVGAVGDEKMLSKATTLSWR
jgi:hypothetical protein